jgi:type II secretory pathway component GspD/PulD (secretin)
VVPSAPPVNSGKQDDADQLRVVCHLNSIPVNNLANELMGIFAQSPYQPAQYQPAQWSPIVIVAESASNSLLISGPKAKVEEAQRLAKEMDHPAAMVRLEVRITEVDRGKVKKSDDAAPEKDKAADESAKGDLHVVSTAEEGATLMHAAVTTLDNQAAQIFMGRMEPRISGAVRGPSGTSNMVTSMSLGTQINLTPRMDRDKTVVLVLKISDNRSGPQEEGTIITESKDGQTVRAPSTEQLTAETTVRLQDGKTLLLGGITRDGKSNKELLISVTAHIVPMGD